jgi:hypothetical protein
MIRRGLAILAIAIAIAVVAAPRADAQMQHADHAAGVHAGSLHMQHDSATHAALHDLLMGGWTGMAMDGRGSAMMGMTLSADSLHGAMLVMHAAHEAHGAAGHSAHADTTQRVHPSMAMSVGGAASRSTDFAVRGDTVSWKQIVEGRACDVSLIPVRIDGRATQLTGKLACAGDELKFRLERQQK